MKDEDIDLAIEYLNRDLDPLEDEENRSERLWRSHRRVLLDEELRQEEKRQRNMSYAQKLQEFGDYLPEDSGMNKGDLERS